MKSRIRGTNKSIFQILFALVSACVGAPHMLQPLLYRPSPAIAYSSSLTPAVTKIQSPGIKLQFPASVSYMTQPMIQAVPQPMIQAVPQPMIQAVPQPIQVATPYQAAVVGSVPVVSPTVVAMAPEPLNAPNPPLPSLGTPYAGGQFHSQDEFKQYSFGHHGGPSTRVETKDVLGRTHGSFAYIDPSGKVQMRKYAAASTMGFKVAASDLPVDTPEVASLKAAHDKSFRTIKEMISGV